MSAANAVPRLSRPNARTLAVWGVLVLLAAFVVYAAQREIRKAAPAPAEDAPHAFAAQQPAQTAAEERFAEAMWGIHTEVRTAAVRMTFAGLAYKMGDGDQASIQTKVTPLTAVFRQAERDLRALDAPASMQELRDHYAGALQLYSNASQEMVKIAQDGSEAHLLQAQEMSERAAGILLEVGDQLWPGEIKPN
jgi:hypothetical protein